MGWTDKLKQGVESLKDTAAGAKDKFEEAGGIDMIKEKGQNLSVKVKKSIDNTRKNVEESQKNKKQNDFVVNSQDKAVNENFIIPEFDGINNKINDLTSDQIINFSEDFFSRMAIGGTQFSSKDLYVNKSIPNKKLKNARQKYATYDSDQEISLLLFDNTLLGKADEGFIVTDKRIYYNLKDFDNDISVGSIDLAEINFLNSFKEGIIINENKLTLSVSFHKYIALTVQLFFNKILANDLNISKKEIEALSNAQINPKILQRIKEYTSDDEGIIFIAWGLDSLTARDFIVCTDNRLLIINRGMLGLQEDIRDFEYDIITSIAIKKEGLGLVDTVLKQCKLEIMAAGSVCNIDTLLRSEAEQVIKIARQRKQELKEAINAPIQNDQPSVDIVSEIKKIKELLDIGAITQEDFDTSKQKLLNKY